MSGEPKKCYGNAGRLNLAQNPYNGTLNRSYDYDQVGRLVEAHTGNEADAHVAGQPFPAQPSGAYSHSYRYDVWGNMTTRVGWGGYNGSYTNWTQTFTNNRRDGLSYDAAGNMTGDGGQYSYDAAGRQTNATYPPSWNGYTLQQSYDGDGQRVKKVDGGVTTYYLRSSVLGGQVVAELNGSALWQRGYVYLGGQLLAMQQAGVWWVVSDPVTKSQRITGGSSGTPPTVIDVDPWGGETSNSSQQWVQPHRYTSYERDGNGSDQARARSYHGAWMRFDQPDPFDGSMDVTDPQSFNRYSYVQNDPVNFTDPTGLEGIITEAPPLRPHPPTSLFGDWFINSWRNGWSQMYSNNPLQGLEEAATQTETVHIGGEDGGITFTFITHTSLANDPQNPEEKKAAATVASGVEAALQILAKGCWDPNAWNSDVREGSRYFANVQNADNYTKGWSSSLSIHDTGVKESAAVAYAGGRQVPDRGTGEPTYVGRYALVVKYYPGQGMAVTSESLSVAHVQSVPGYVFGTNKNVNVDWAQQLLSVAPKCKPDH